MEPIVFPCKVGWNLSVRASVICRRARSVPGVGLKVAEVGPLLEPQVVRWIVTNTLFWKDLPSWWPNNGEVVEVCWIFCSCLRNSVSGMSGTFSE